MSGRIAMTMWRDRPAPSFPSTTTRTIVREISYKCVLFCQVERRTAGVHTPDMHYVHGPCRGCRPVDACFARVFSHVLVSHVAQSGYAFI